MQNNNLSYVIHFNCGESNQDLTKRLEENIRLAKDEFLDRYGDSINEGVRVASVVIGDEPVYCPDLDYFAPYQMQIRKFKKDNKYALMINVEEGVKKEDADIATDAIMKCVNNHINGVNDVILIGPDNFLALFLSDVLWGLQNKE